MMLTSQLMIVGLAAATGLSAQDAPRPPIAFDAEFHLTWAQPSLSKVTGRTLGEGLGVGVMLPSPFSPEQCSGFHLGFMANTFPGTQRQTARTSLKNCQFTLDICFPSWWKNTSWFLGLSANRYSATNSGTETWAEDPVESNYVQPVDTFMVRSKDTKGVRGGFRAGFEVRFNRHLSATLVFQQTELTQRILEQLDPAKYVYTESFPVNPSWFETGIRYTF